MPPSSFSADSSSEFKDQKTGLVVFGILTVMVGLVCALFVPLMLFGQTMSGQAAGPQSFRVIAPAIIVYGGLAVILVWLGIGSIMVRRWARALLLIFSWSWLIVGVVSMIVMAFMFPHMMDAMNAATPAGQPKVSSAANSFIMLISLGTMGVIFIILPSAWVFFYQNRHVKRTCEARDPIVRWTDRCPLPVITICLWLGFSVPMMLLMAVTYNSVLPFFGTFVAGSFGSALSILLALVWSYSAWAIYKLRLRGWWLVVASILIFAVSSFMTYSQHEVSELYVLMGYPEAQIAQMQQFSIFQGHTMKWVSVAGVVPILGYLLYVRKFFVRS